MLSAAKFATKWRRRDHRLSLHSIRTLEEEEEEKEEEEEEGETSARREGKASGGERVSDLGRARAAHE